MLSNYKYKENFVILQSINKKVRKQRWCRCRLPPLLHYFYNYDPY